MNQNFSKPNLFYNFISSGFDQFHPPQSSVIHQPPYETGVEMLQARENLMKYIQNFLKKFSRISFRETPKVLSLAWEKFFEIQHALREKQHQLEDMPKLLHKLLKDLQIISEELAKYINSLSWNCPAFYDDDEEFSIPMSEICKSSLTAITPDFLITDSLIMEDKHLDTIPEMESDEENESSVEDLNLTPSESEDLSDIEKTISIKIDLHHFNAGYDLMESLLNQDTLIISSPKFDSFLEEFSGELAHIDLIPLGTNEADFDPEEDIYLVERFFDSLMEEIDLFLTPDESMPPGIKNDDYDSEGDILLHEELLSNDSP
nr:hypothetical protein [Tanacetum cinerariifolium]